MTTLTPATEERVVAANTTNFRAETADAPLDAPAEHEAAHTRSTADGVPDHVRGASTWFYWIAALSAVNSVATLAGGSWQFLAGLGMTQVVDVIAYEIGGIATTLALLVNFLPVGFFLVMGYYGRVGARWALMAGLAVFGLDALIVAFFQDWVGLAFHAYALWRIFGGLRRAPVPPPVPLTRPAHSEQSPAPVRHL